MLEGVYYVNSALHVGTVQIDYIWGITMILVRTHQDTGKDKILGAVVSV